MMIQREDVLDYIHKRKSDLVNWDLTSTEVHREENYLIQSPSGKTPELDQNRSVNKQSLSVSLTVSKSGTRLGAATQDLNLYSSLEAQMDAMIQRAHLSSEQTWTYPVAKSSDLKEPKLCYSGFEKDLTMSSQMMVEELVSAAQNIEGAEFNSAELFNSVVFSKRDLSNGFKNESRRSKIYTEVCFSAADNRDSNEFLVTQMAAAPQQISFKDLCQRSSEGAKGLIVAEKMPAGKLNVLVDAEILGQIFNDALTHLNANNCYFHLPFQNESEKWIDAYEGAPFSLSLDPQMDLAFGSQVYNHEGLEQKPTRLVYQNTIEKNMVSSRMGQYLHRDPTLTGGNIVIESAGQPKEKLLKSGRVLEILQFSALFASPQDLTFSSELRLGRLWEDGKPRFVRGGNVSGNFKENFRHLQFSTEQTFVNLNEESLECSRAYQGPSFGLLNDVMVSS